jgi:mRNA interferase MazF
MSSNYIPDRGDIVRLDTESLDSEKTQAEKRNALVISPKTYNEKTGLAIFCPIKNKEKGYPFEVSIQENSKIKGVILSDQLKSLNWKIRNAEYVCKLSAEKLSEVTSKIRTLV